MTSAEAAAAQAGTGAAVPARCRRRRQCLLCVWTRGRVGRGKLSKTQPSPGKGPPPQEDAGEGAFAVMEQSSAGRGQRRLPGGGGRGPWGRGDAPACFKERALSTKGAARLTWGHLAILQPVSAHIRLSVELTLDPECLHRVRKGLEYALETSATDPGSRELRPDSKAPRPPAHHGLR